MIIKETLELVRERLSGLEVIVEGVAVGLFYAGVVVRSNHGVHGGVAYVFRAAPSCSPVKNAGSLHELDPLTLAELSLSPNLAEAAVGVAAINALSQVAMCEDARYRPVNVDVTDIVRKNERVAVIGYMEPVIRKLLGKTREVIVSEIIKVDNPIVPILPPSEAEPHIETANVVIITGSTLVNKTIDEILSTKLRAREVAVAGPTASILPDILFDHGVTSVMGIEITDPSKMLRVITQGGGTQQLLSTCARKKAYFKPKLIE
ncbi:MAG: DUF364 domain-containing protein [Candidatus Jordarchaeales archaeon]